MRESVPLRVFISYAHKDASMLATRLQGDIRRQGYEVWLDTARLTAGASWTLELERALDSSHVVIALLSRGSYTSDICRAEQLRALRNGKCVIPVLAQAEADRPLFLESRQYRDLSAGSKYDEELPDLLEDIRRRTGVALIQQYRETYITVPPLPANYVERPAELEALRAAVLGDNTSRRVALIALKGMGGIGKTVLAQALCHDEVTQAAFPDGVIWLSIGQNPRDLLILFWGGSEGGWRLAGKLRQHPVGDK